MSLVVNHNKCTLCEVCVGTCPFNAIVTENGQIAFTAACKMCKICIKGCPLGAIGIIDEVRAEINKDEWKGIMIYVEHVEGNIHPVTFELIGKARELAAKINHPVYALFLGHEITKQADELLKYGVDKVFVYDNAELEHFRVDSYTAAFEDCVKNVKPSTILVGATSVGRSLAPRIATRFRTGLTADCTVLDVKENTDLVQIRPAFGGNIMAQIITPNHRPQMATVRYKIMDTAEKVENITGKVEVCDIAVEKLASQIEVLGVHKKEVVPGINDAEVLVVAGRGIKEEKDMAMVKELADLLGGQIAVTRPLIEAGWGSHNQQIGLSGRTVRPKLLITLGVSGAVQFTAGMGGAENVFAINNDPNAAIFNVSHYGIVGDIYEVIPKLIASIKNGADISELVG
ncbi:electron transfer flavoprotein subunit alpha [Alkalicella caledoniensis]|uniref:Electron transfer flavoprotein subunit alpha n=1 Tax=Alkalicella caledoniensis TaxID=2731377 RepID=A0A7G9W571_ALKCA|nr:electron transfer flavoprotein subunit alpha [Alkalicella caledoniensis]QNO13833.1 electron transfer flavoprotein subunit alpha [Alkalicella caledoniensis]